jgi:hypothetical protein
MLKVKFKCKCVREIVAMGVVCGMTFSGTAFIDEYGDTTFVINFPCAGGMKCRQEWFENYFRITEQVGDAQ